MSQSADVQKHGRKALHSGYAFNNAMLLKGRFPATTIIFLKEN
jgi:hypothetical protein